MEIDQNVQIDLISCLKGFGTLVGMFFLPITYFEYIFHVKIQHFVTLKFVPDPRGDKSWTRIQNIGFIS
jgi:hypothetical protein